MSPVKEPSFFSLETRPENMEPSLQLLGHEIEARTLKFLNGPMEQKLGGGIVRDWNDYLRLFRNAREERAVGEASVSYLSSPTAPDGIASRFPDARIIIVLRSPADRAFSQYLHNMSDGFISQSFSQYLHTGMHSHGNGIGMQNTCLNMGLYAEQVQRYLDRFPPGQVGIWTYEETCSDPARFLVEVMDFLGVDSSFRPDMSRRHNQPHVALFPKAKRFLRRLGLWQVAAKSAPTTIHQMIRKAVHRPAGSLAMSSKDRAMLVDYYSGDICRLEKLIHRDLTAWRTC